jgi:hypothetical protein
MVTTTRPAAAALPFVRTQDDETIRFWVPERSGDYAVDCETGRRYARDLLVLIRSEGNPALFGSVIRAISEVGVFGGVEIGFCSHIGIELIGLGG